MAAKAQGKSGKTASGAAKKPAAPKTGSGTKANARAARKKPDSLRERGAGNNALRDEVAALLMLALAFIFLLSNFGLAGVVGETIQKVMFGLFGAVEYVLPLVLAGLILVILFNRNISVVRIKAAAALAGVIVLSGICGLIINVPEVGSAGLGEFYRRCSLDKTGGGFFGGLLTWLLSPIGTVGSCVVLIILFIICLVVITERSFIKGVQNQGSKVYNTAKTDYENYREQAAVKRQLHEERRQQLLAERMERQVKEQAQPDAPASKEHAAHPSGREHPPRPFARESFFVPPHEEAIVPDVFEPGPFDPIDISGDARIKRSRNKAKGVVSDTVIPRDNSSIDLHEVEVELPREDAFSQDIYDPCKIEKNTAFTLQEEKKAPAESPVQKAPGRERKDAQERERNPDETDRAPSDSRPKNRYAFPPIHLLDRNTDRHGDNQDRENQETAIRLRQTLQNFGVRVAVTDISCGPSVTRFELQPEQGVKVSKIVSLADDIKLNLAAADIRIEAPIPGKAAVGIEVPNKETRGVKLRELLESETFKKFPSSISFAAGRDIAGQIIVADIAKMPHVLIAGATGSGKSVCINTIIMSILYKAAPEDVKLIMIDPKVVELSVYNGIPHLLIPVVTDPKKASGALNWAVAEMTVRYKKFADCNVRDLKGYNEKAAAAHKSGEEDAPGKMPQIVIIIDELADLMMVAPGEVEDAICRLAQLARAAGIHLVIATQRPSVNVITGLIKANVPSRIAFSVSSGVDSRTIIDMNGAEKLLGKGDMLFYPSGYQKPVRVQGAFVSDREVGKVVEFLKENADGAVYSQEIASHLENQASMEDSQAFGGDRDAYFAEAGRLIIEQEKASSGMLQRYYKIGFNRAARIMDQLADAGVVGQGEGTKSRKILMTMEEFEAYLKQ